MDIITNQFIPKQFPSFYNTQGPNFIAFIKAYYEWMESQGNPLYYSRNFLTFQDIDTTLPQFIQYFQDEFMNNLPTTMTTNPRLLLKHILDLYRSKGTKRGYELLFRILFNEDIRIYIPNEFIFKPSDNTWVKNSYIEVTSSPYLPLLVGQSIQSSSSEASALVEDFNVLNINNKIVNVLTLSNVEGNFRFGSFLSSKDVPQLTVNSSINTIIENFPVANYFNWTQSLPITFMANGFGPYRGSETRQFAWSNGSLYAAIGDWTDPAPNNPSNPGSQILRLDSPTSSWVTEINLGTTLETSGQVDFIAVGALFATEITTDNLGNPISPVEVMIASLWNNANTAGLYVFQRIGGIGASWSQVAVVNTVNCPVGTAAQIRSFTKYKDSNTGVDTIFGGTSPFGIFNATYNPATANLIWSASAEVGSNNVVNNNKDRVMSFANSSNGLFATTYNAIITRLDGPSPSWTKIYSNTTPLSNNSSGFRALTLVPTPNNDGNMFLFSVENKPCEIFSMSPNPPYTVTTEINVSNYLSEQLGTPVGYGIAGYNDMVPYYAANGSVDYYIGLSAAAPSSPIAFGETYPSAMFLIRHQDTTYELRTVSDPAISPSPPLVAVRSMIVSQFPTDPPGTWYAGGFDAGYGRTSSFNSNWIYKGISNPVQANAQFIIPTIPMVIGSLSAISIIEGGQNFNVGDIVDVSGAGSSALATVSSVTNEDGKVTFLLENGGFGFSLGAVVSVTGGGGSGATFSIGSITNQQSYSVDTDVINLYFSTIMDVPNFTMNISNVNGTFVNGEVVIATANAVALDFAYVSGNSLVNTEILSNTSLGISGLEIIYIDNPNYVNLTGPQASLINANLVTGAILIGATSGHSIIINSVLPLAQYNTNATIISVNTTVMTVNNANGNFLQTSNLVGQTSGANAFINSIIRNTNWAFPVPSNTNLDSKISSAFTYQTIIGGTISSLTSENPGISYATNPTVSIVEPSIAQMQLPDGLGGFLGQDANVIASASISTGIITSLEIIDSGYGFLPGEILTISSNNPVIATGTSIVDGVGVSQGYWLNSKSFLDADQNLQDSFYYQKFSYEILAPRMLDTYQQFVMNLVHPVQMALFGRFYFIDEQQANSALISSSMVQT